MEMILAHVNEEPVPPSQITENAVPAVLEKVVMSLSKRIQKFTRC